MVIFYSCFVFFVSQIVCFKYRYNRSKARDVYTQTTLYMRNKNCKYENMIRLVIASIFLWTGGHSCQISDTFEPCSVGNNKPFPYMSDRCPDCDYLSNDRSDLYDLEHDTWYITAFNMTTRYVPPYGCGTRTPIWMNGTIPMIGEGVVSRTACVATFESLCTFSYIIKVKRCDSSKTVYCLVNLPSSIQQRYCFETSMTPSTATSNTTLMTLFLTTSATKPSSPQPLSTEVMREIRTSRNGDLDRSSLTPTTSTIRSTKAKAPSTIRYTTTRSLTMSSTTQTTKSSPRLSLSTEVKQEAYRPRNEENGIQIWVIAVIAGLIVAVVTLIAMIIAMKRRFSKKKDDNDYEVPEKKYVNDTQSDDYMTLDPPPLAYKEAGTAITDQNEARYVSINDICT